LHDGGEGTAVDRERDVEVAGLWCPGWDLLPRTKLKTNKLSIFRQTISANRARDANDWHVYGTPQILRP
jgi:hypothetical protein